MTITPFSSVRAGATIVPGATGTSGQYEAVLSPGGKGATSYPNTNQVLLATFWPTNATGNPADTPTNMLNLSLTGQGIQSTSPHYYWVCYEGWNKWEGPTYNIEGGAIESGNKPVLFALYNGTPYSIAWGIFTSRLNSVAEFSTSLTGLILTPGGTATFEGPKCLTTYTASGTKYDHVIGPCAGASYLHAIATNSGGRGFYYSSNTYYAHSGYLQLLMVTTGSANVGLSV